MNKVYLVRNIRLLLQLSGEIRSETHQFFSSLVVDIADVKWNVSFHFCEASSWNVIDHLKDKRGFVTAVLIEEW